MNHLNQKRKRENYYYYEVNPNLPIYDKVEEIIESIEKYQVIIITGATGCGKTTQVPKMIYFKAKSQKKNVKILLTQPRRLAAESIKRTLDKEIKDLNVVGVQIAAKNLCNPNNSIFVKTTGIFLEELIHKNSHNVKYSHIIIDEVHERDINIDFVLILVRKYIKEHPNVKLILMSATISPEIFANYFSITEINKVNNQFPKIEKLLNVKIEQYNNYYDDDDWYLKNEKKEDDRKETKLLYDAAKIIKIIKPNFIVQFFYLNEIIENLNKTSLKLSQEYKNNLMIKKIEFKPTFDINSPEVSKHIYEICNYLIELIHTLKVFGTQNDSILIFLPGIAEITALKNYIIQNFSRINEIKFIILHSNVDEEIQFGVFEASKLRKIILATNIAESSITIQDTSFIIDFCLLKELYYQTRNKRECLNLKWASIASLNQRAGRAGRVKNGFCFRLITREFLSQLKKYPSPEILRIPLEKVILKLKIYNCGEPRDILHQAIDKPSDLAIDHSIINLFYYGALRECDNSESGILTTIGKIYAELPIDIKYSRLIMLSRGFNMIDFGIIVASILSQDKSIFKELNIKNYSRELFYKTICKYCNNSNSDIIGAYRAFRDWFKQFGFKFEQIYMKGMRRLRIEEKNMINYMKKFCKENYLNFKVLREAVIIIADIKKKLKRLNMYYDYESSDIKIPDNENTYLKMKYIIAGAFFGNMLKGEYYSKEDIQLKKNYFQKDYTNYLFIKTNNKNSNLVKIKLEEKYGKSNDFKEFSKTKDECAIEYLDSNGLINEKIYKEILFITSNRVRENFTLNNPENDFNSPFYNIQEVNFCFKMSFYDNFFFQKVFLDSSSINHITIEKNEENIPLYNFVYDSYFQTRVKPIAKYITSLPQIPMIDILLNLIFCPNAIFIPNGKETQYKSYLLNGQKKDFSHLFCSLDVQNINAIRISLNKLIFNINGNYNAIFIAMEKNFAQLINRKRFKIIKKDTWNTLLYKYFPSTWQNYFNNQLNENQLNEEILKFQNNYREIYSNQEINDNDFFQPLKHLSIKEDYRLWTKEGQEKLKEERYLYNQMKNNFFENIKERKKIFEQTQPELYCKQCGKKTGFISQLDGISLLQKNGEDYIKTSYTYGINKIPINKLKEKELDIDDYIIGYRASNDNDPDYFLLCPLNLHVIGYCIGEQNFFSEESQILIKLFGIDEFIDFDKEYLKNDQRKLKPLIRKSKMKLFEEINTLSVCEICEYDAQKIAFEEMNKKHNDEINKFGERICGTNMNLEHVMKEHEILFTNELISNQQLKKIIYENASKKFLEHLKTNLHILNMKELEDEKFE